MARNRIICITIVLTILIAAGVLCGQDPRIRPLLPQKPVTITGEVSVILGGDGLPVVSPWFQIQRGSKPLSKLVVTLNGHKLRETMPGQYAGIRITDITPRPGLRLTFGIESAAKPLTATGFPKTSILRGTVTIGSIAAITSPASKSRLDLKGLGKALIINWTGGTPAFQASLLKTTAGSPLELFSRSGLPARSCAVPTSLLAAGNTYSAGVHYTMGAFTFLSGKESPAIVISSDSSVILRCSVFSDFAVN